MVLQSWETREKPILRAIVDAEENGENVDRAARMAVELDDRVYNLCIDRLHRAGFIDALILHGDDEIARTVVHRSEPPALTEVGLWPRSDSLQALVELFETLAEREADEVRKGRFRSVAASLRGLLALGADVSGALQGTVSVYNVVT